MKYDLEIYRDMESPPGGWKFTVTETGGEFTAFTRQTLQGKVRSHMEANGVQLPFPFSDWFADTLCKQMNLDERWCGPTRNKLKEPGITKEAIGRFINTMWGMAKTGFKLVPQELADNRSRICAKCPKNIDHSMGCFSCESILEKVEKIARGRKTAEHDRLHYCGACSCRLTLKVLVPKDVLDAAEAGEEPKYDPGCWRLTEK